MTTLSTAVETFLKDGKYTRDWSEETLRTYGQSFRALCHILGNDFPLSSLNKHGLTAFVVALRDRGLTCGGVNVRLRSVNAFLSWAHEQEFIREPLRVKLLPSRAQPLRIVSKDDVKRIINYRPRHKVERRTWTLLLTLLDTGLRIGEALGIQRQDVDLDALTVRVRGKGRRERVVPISIELRKHLFRLMTPMTAEVSTGLLFATRDGGVLSRHNIHRDIRLLCNAIGVKGRVNPHAFRHAFAVHSLSNGMNLYSVSRILGHSNIATTQLYLRSAGIEELRVGHERFSPLASSATTSR